jgi:hypothetical protein
MTVGGVALAAASSPSISFHRHRRPKRPHKFFVLHSKKTSNSLFAHLIRFPSNNPYRYLNLPSLHQYNTQSPPYPITSGDQPTPHKSLFDQAQLTQGNNTCAFAMSEEWDTVTKIGSKVRGGPAAPRERVIRGEAALNAARRSGAVIATEKKFGGTNAVGCEPFFA